MNLVFAIIGLVLPVLLGFLSGVGKLFDDPDAAVGHLNRFALYIAFPALIFVGLAKSTTPLPADWTFWVAVPLAFCIAAAPLKWVGDRAERSGGTLALLVSFGNVAYLGLPVVDVVLGHDAMGIAGLVVGAHVLLSLTVGPILLLRWSGDGEGVALGASVRKVLKQPLFWAPVLGILSRAVPVDLRMPIVDILAPLGKAAAPVALFLLGLYVNTHLRRLKGLDGLVALHLAVKLAWLPLVTFAVIQLLGLDGVTAQVLLLLSAMPPAITTFAIATEFGVGADRVAQAIVAGSILSAVTIPLVAWGL